jgi:ubiquinone/menaquinone biosynthesis C-methylase UbiE
MNTRIDDPAQREANRRAVYEIAETVAPGWERWRARIEDNVAPVREWLLRALAPRPGETVLELAAGAGDTGFEAAALVGPSGRLISTDFSPGMVGAARRRGAELGLGNVRHAVMDAEHIELDTDSVDGVLCRFGYMLMADPAAALAETRRVLRPGGRLAFAVWGAPEHNPWITIGFGLLIARGHLPPPEPDAPTPFALASAGHTRSLLRGTGFGTVRTQEIPVRFRFRDLGEYVAYSSDTGGVAAEVLRSLSADELAALEAQLRAAFAPFETDAGYALPGLALAAVAS